MYPVVRRRSMARALIASTVFPPCGVIPKPVVKLSLIRLLRIATGPFEEVAAGPVIDWSRPPFAALLSACRLRGVALGARDPAQLIRVTPTVLRKFTTWPYDCVRLGSLSSDG